jgi:hypothetical protein
MNPRSLSLLSVMATVVLACGGDKHAADPAKMDPGMMAPASPDPTSGAPTEAAMVTEARAKFPRLIDLHHGVIARTCSPNPGVCHQANNYPDMHTAGNFLALVKAPCNVQIPDPAQGWDACESKADKVRVGSTLTDIAWIEKKSAGRWRIAFRDAAPSTGMEPLEVYTPDRETVFAPPLEWQLQLALTAGQKEADLAVGISDPFITAFSDSVLLRVVGGDPNRNGVWGAEDASIARGALVEPKSLATSYLWGRITGSVPGTRMPLANQPLSSSEYVAIACWIEGLDAAPPPSAEDPIRYDDCSFAQNPTDYARRPSTD